MEMKTLEAVFQRLMDKMLGDLQPKCAFIYIDNITIFSPSMGQHLIDLGEVFSWLAKVNLKVNLDKCNFVKTEVKVLGHLVSKQGIRPDPKKVETIQGLAPPKEVTGVKSFMGVVNYFRKLYPNAWYWLNRCCY